LQRTLQGVDGPPGQIACHKHVPDVCHDRRLASQLKSFERCCSQASNPRDQFDVGQTSSSQAFTSFVFGSGQLALPAGHNAPSWD
jgi:hypothetical protein